MQEINDQTIVYYHDHIKSLVAKSTLGEFVLEFCPQFIIDLHYFWSMMQDDDDWWPWPSIYTSMQDCLMNESNSYRFFNPPKVEDRTYALEELEEKHGITFW